MGEEAMRPNRLKQVWQEGRAVINGWLQIPHGFAVEAMASQGWDSLTVDLQHGPVGYDTALPMLQALSGSNIAALARVPWNEPGIIMKMLDAGCYGIICPMINSREQAEQFVGACRYAPRGYRSLGPTRVSYYAGADYAKHANDTVVTLAMIETAEAVQNLDEILDTPELDGVFIGPNDLSQSLGYEERGDLTHPDLVAILDQILEGCLRRNLVAGLHCTGTAYARQMIEKGFRFITIMSDHRFMVQAAQQAIEEIKGDAPVAAMAAGGGRAY
jgi:4-hydroxy-2-oxoheptanedioate aldolase